MFKGYLSEAFSKINYFKSDSDRGKKRNAESMTEVDENEYPVLKRSRKSPTLQKEDNVSTTSLKRKLLNWAPSIVRRIWSFGGKASSSNMTSYESRESDRDRKRKGWLIAETTSPNYKSSSLAREPLHTNQHNLRNPFQPATTQIPVIPLDNDDDDDIVDSECNGFKQNIKSDVGEENFNPRFVRPSNKNQFVSLTSPSISNNNRITKKSRRKWKPYKYPAVFDSIRIDEKEAYQMLLNQNSKASSSYASLFEADKKFGKRRDASVQIRIPRPNAFFKDNLTDADKLRNLKREIERKRFPASQSQSQISFSTTPWETKLQKNVHLFGKQATPVSRIPVVTNFFQSRPNKFSASFLELPVNSALLKKSKSVEYLNGKGSFSQLSQISPSHQSTLPNKTEQLTSSLFKNSSKSSLSIVSSKRNAINSCGNFDETWLNILKQGIEQSKKNNEEKVRDEESRYEAMQKEKEKKLFESNRKRMESISSKFSIFTVEDDEEEMDKMLALTAEMETAIDSAFQPNPPSEVLTQGFGINIMRKDIETLAGLNWLNDEIINFYTNLLMERGKQNNYPSCYAFNTFFYPKLMSSGHGALKRWTRKVDVFAYDLILIPVHLGMHWCLAVIDFRSKKIQYYDSMGAQNNDCLNALRHYLQDERRDKKKEDFDTSDWKLEAVKNIPQQMNGSDCGMFACKYAEYITRNARITFTQAQMPYFRRRMVYEIVTKKLL